MRQVQIEGFPRYDITDEGRVWSNYGKGRYLKHSLVGKGRDYLQVILSKKGTGYAKKIHILVAQVFVINPKPEEYDCVNHRDGIKTHNWPDNLQWCTDQMNHDHAWNINLRDHGLSDHKGVTWHKDRKKWMSQISVKGQHIYIGSYELEIDAAQAYNNYVIENNLDRSINYLRNK